MSPWRQATPGALALAVRNLVRRPSRALAGAGAVFLATALLFSVTLVLISTRYSLRAGMERLGADVLVVPRDHVPAAQAALVMGEPTSFYMPRAVAQQVAAVSGVRAASPQVYVETLATSMCCTGRMFLIGFDPASDFTVSPWLAARLGRPLTDSEALIGNMVIASPGDRLKFYGQDFTVAALLEPTGMGLDETVFIPLPAAYQMAAESRTRAEKPLAVGRDQISAVLVRAAPGQSPEQLAARIQGNVSGVAAVATQQISRTVGEQLVRAVQGLVFAGGAILVMALLLIGVLFAAIARERQREFGLLRAIGATASFVARLVLAEAALLAAAGALAGILAGGALVALFRALIATTLRIPVLLPPVPALAALALVAIGLATLAGAGAALLPALGCARQEPYAAIRRGE